MKRKIIDTSRCTGCLNCEAACIEAKKGRIAPDFSQNNSIEYSRNKVGLTKDKTPLPQFCRHCEEPFCVEACSSGALSKSDHGLVLVDVERCVGCFMCVMSCPYGMLRPTATGAVACKCDACMEREAMACVAACPSGCLQESNEPGPLVEYRVREY